jgi:hypothetical protein
MTCCQHTELEMSNQISDVEKGVLAAKQDRISGHFKNPGGVRIGFQNSFRRDCGNGPAYLRGYHFGWEQHGPPCRNGCGARSNGSLQRKLKNVGKNAHNVHLSANKKIKQLEEEIIGIEKRQKDYTTALDVIRVQIANITLANTGSSSRVSAAATEGPGKTKEHSPGKSSPQSGGEVIATPPTSAERRPPPPPSKMKVLSEIPSMDNASSDAYAIKEKCELGRSFARGSRVIH